MERRSCGTALGFLFTTSLYPSPFQECCLQFVIQEAKNWGYIGFITKLSPLIEPIVLLQSHSDGLFITLSIESFLKVEIWVVWKNKILLFIFKLIC